MQKHYFWYASVAFLNIIGILGWSLTYSQTTFLISSPNKCSLDSDRCGNLPILPSFLAKTVQKWSISPSSSLLSLESLSISAFKSSSRIDFGDFFFFPQALGFILILFDFQYGSGRLRTILIRFKIIFRVLRDGKCRSRTALVPISHLVRMGQGPLEDEIGTGWFRTPDENAHFWTCS